MSESSRLWLTVFSWNWAEFGLCWTTVTPVELSPDISAIASVPATRFAGGVGITAS